MLRAGRATIARDAEVAEGFIDLLMENGEWDIAEAEARCSQGIFERLAYQLPVERGPAAKYARGRSGGGIT